MDNGGEPVAGRASSAILRPQLPLLTALRFFAAIEVALLHITINENRSELLIGNVITGGDEAVTFFFVLSGFILTYVYSSAAEHDGLVTSAARFWQARVARIVPVYLFGLALNFPYYSYASLVSKVIPLGMFLTGLVLTPLFLQAWWPPTAILWNGAGWSLSVEALFYTLFPMLAVSMVRVHRVLFLVLALAFVVLMGFFRQAISDTPDFWRGTLHWHWFVSCFPFFHLPKFILGMAIGRLFLFGPPVKPATHALLFYAGAAALLGLLQFRPTLPGWAFGDMFVVPICAVIIFGAARADDYCRLLTLPLFGLLGEASYAIYLLHGSIVFYANNFIAKILGLHMSLDVKVAVMIPLVVGVSIPVFLYIEKPLRCRILGVELGILKFRRAKDNRAGPIA